MHALAKSKMTKRPAGTAATARAAARLPLLLLLLLLLLLGAARAAAQPPASGLPDDPNTAGGASLAPGAGPVAGRGSTTNPNQPPDPVQTTKPCGEPDTLDESPSGVRPTTTDLAMWERELMAAVAAAKAELDAAIRNVDVAWRTYCAKHNLPMLAGDSGRRAKFLANLKAWQALNNNKNDPYLAYGITQFAHLNAAEFNTLILQNDMKTLQNGTTNPTSTARRHLMQGGLSCNAYQSWNYAGQTVLTSWDWRSSNLVTPVRNQYGCGSCSDFASIGALETCWIRRWWSLGYRASNTDLSEQDFLNCISGDQCKGAWPDSVLDRYICSGAPFESAEPYTAIDNVNKCPSVSRYNTGSVGWTYVPNNSDDLARAVRHNPTVIGVDASTWQGLAAGWVRNCGEPWAKINHAVLVVGWVDRVPMSNGETWDYWFIKNSWGSGFSNSGYIWIRKGCTGQGPYGMFRYPGWTPICSV